MSIHIMMSRSLASLVAVSCLALAACEKEEKDSASDGSGDGTGSASASEGGDTDPSEGGSDPTDGSNSNSGSASDSSDTSGQTCEGDWTLGSVPFSGDPMLGQACDGVVPKNCADGTFINFASTGECICIAECSSLGVSVGENCTEDGTWVCAEIKATNASMNSATVCVNKNWNLCTAAG